MFENIIKFPYIKKHSARVQCLVSCWGKLPALNYTHEYELLNIAKYYSQACATIENIRLICKYLQKHKLEHKENGEKFMCHTNGKW